MIDLAFTLKVLEIIATGDSDTVLIPFSSVSTTNPVVAKLSLKALVLGLSREATSLMCVSRQQKVTGMEKSYL